MKAILFLILIAVLILQYKLWASENGISEVKKLQHQVFAQQTNNTVSRQRNGQLDAEVKELKLAEQAIEERARTELGMIKEDEVFYQIVTPSRDKSKGEKSHD